MAMLARVIHEPYPVPRHRILQPARLELLIVGNGHLTILEQIRIILIATHLLIEQLMHMYGVRFRSRWGCLEKRFRVLDLVAEVG